MGNLPESLIGEFIDGAVQDRVRAERLLSAHPDLIDARWIHGETVLHFLAVEGFTDAARFLDERHRCCASIQLGPNRVGRREMLAAARIDVDSFFADDPKSLDRIA